MASPIRDFALNSDGSFVKTGSDFNFVAGRDATKQGARIRIQTFKREIFVDEAQGVDYINTVLNKGADPVVSREAIKDAIADTPDVIAVVGANFVKVSGRNYSIKYRYRDVYSEGPIDDELAVP